MEDLTKWSEELKSMEKDKLIELLIREKASKKKAESSDSSSAISNLEIEQDIKNESSKE